MKSLTREAIQRMVDFTGGSGVGGGGGGNTDGLASESWVDENYIAIPYWENLFEAVGTKTTTVGSGTPTTVDYTFDANEKPETKTTTEGGVTTTVTTAVTGVKVKPHYLTGLFGINKTLYFEEAGTSYNVGIGVQSPSEKLHVNGNSKLWGNIFMNGYINGLTNIDGLVYIYNAKVGIGVSSPTSKLHVSGNVAANNFIAGTDNGSYIKIGPIRIEYEQSTNSLKVYNTTANTVANLYATGGISSLGIGSGGSGSSGALADLDDVTLTNPQAGQILVYRNSHWVNENMPTPGGSGTVTSISAGTGLSNSTGGAITTTGTISISSTYQTYISHGETAYGWGNHATAGYLTGINSTMINTALGFTLSGTAGETYDLDAFLTGIDASMINTALGFTLSGTSGSTYDLDNFLTSVAFSDLTNHPTTLSGYGITDAVDNSTTWWGAQISNGAVSGNMTNVGNITMSNSSRIDTANNGDLYIGNSSNAAWVMIQDMCSALGDTYWKIYTSGSALFGATTFNGSLTINGNIDTVNNVTLSDEGVGGSRFLYFGASSYIKKINTMFVIGVNGTETINVYNNLFFAAVEIRSSVGVYSAGYVTAASDINLKDKIGTPTLTTEDIASASPILFKWKDRKDQDVHVGAIAQEWQKLLPEVVRQQDGVLSMDYGVAALVSAMTIAKTVVNHEQRLAILENELNKQKEL